MPCPTPGTLTGAVSRARPRVSAGHATFLVSQSTFRDFELKFRVKLEEGQGGSGVIIRGIRSTRPHTQIGANLLPTGPLVKVGDGYGGWGCLTWEQNGTPQIPMSKEMQEAVAKVVVKNDFNDYYIKCAGKHVMIRVNGFTTVDQIWDVLPVEGLLAFQIHYARGTKSVQFRDVEIKELKPGPRPAKGYLGLSIGPSGGIHGGPTIDVIGAGSPAAKAGLRHGDMIVAVNDTKVFDILQLRAAMDNLKQNSGERITFRIDRDGKEMTIAVTVGEPKIVFDEMKRQGLEGGPKKAIEPPPTSVRADGAEDKAALAITKLGGTIRRDEKAAWKPVIGVMFAKATDADLKMLAAFKQLQTLGLGDTQVSDAGLKELKEIKSLETLNLSKTSVTDAGLGAAEQGGEEEQVGMEQGEPGQSEQHEAGRGNPVIDTGARGIAVDRDRVAPMDRIAGFDVVGYMCGHGATPSASRLAFSSSSGVTLLGPATR